MTLDGQINRIAWVCDITLTDPDGFKNFMTRRNQGSDEYQITHCCLELAYSLTRMQLRRGDLSVLIAPSDVI